MIKFIIPKDVINRINSIQLIKYTVMMQLSLSAVTPRDRTRFTHLKNLIIV